MSPLVKCSQVQPSATECEARYVKGHSDTTIRICSNKFCAGMVIRKGRVIQAAPILHAWIGHKLEEVLDAAKRMCWHLEII